MTLRKAASIIAAAIAFAWLLGTSVYSVQQRNDVAVSAEIAKATPFVLSAVPLYTSAPHAMPRTHTRRVAPKLRRPIKHHTTKVR